MAGDGCNIAYAAVDRHADGPTATRTALRFVAKDWDGVTATRDLSYGELAHFSRRFTNVLRSLDVGPGSRIFTIMDRAPELYITIMGHCATAAWFHRCSQRRRAQRDREPRSR